VTCVTSRSDKGEGREEQDFDRLQGMDQEAIHELLTTLRETRHELEALKRMFFDHRPQFVQAFAQHRAAVEESGYLKKIDEAIAAVEKAVAVS
jgi:hypothetical protein